jgi:hypothetical protein
MPQKTQIGDLVFSYETSSVEYAESNQNKKVYITCYDNVEIISSSAYKSGTRVEQVSVCYEYTGSEMKIIISFEELSGEQNTLAIH